MIECVSESLDSCVGELFDSTHVIAFGHDMLPCYADASVAMDVFSMTKNSPQLLKLDHCCQIVSCLQLLLASAHQAYAQTAVETTLVLLTTFGEMIQQTCQRKETSVGVDLTFDERKSKCEIARRDLKELCLPLQGLVSRSGPSQLVAGRLFDMLTAL